MPKAEYIAVVDDEVSVCRALQRLLQSEGFEVEIFESGGAFLESLGRRAPSCVLLDHHMSEMTGLEVQARLNAIHSPCAVIFVTGNDSDELHQCAVALGASAYLRKPVEQDALFDAVRNSVARH